MSVKAAPKPVAKKPVKASKSATPLLDAAKAVNPHRPEWNKEVAMALRGELATVLTNPDLTSEQALHLLAEYGPLAGWKDVAKQIVKATTPR